MGRTIYYFATLSTFLEFKIEANCKFVDLRDLSESGEGVAERVRLDFRAQVPHENVEMFCN